MDLVVRPFGPDDAHACADLHVAAWRAAYRGIVADEFLASERFVAGRRQLWERIATSPPPAPGAGPVTLVAVVDEVLRGFATWGPPGPGAGGSGPDPGAPAADDPVAGAVWAIYVDPSHWGEGVGAALMAASLDGLDRCGRSRVSLWVLADNARARSFYAAWGFVDTGRGRPVDLGPGGSPHEVEMRRDGPTG